MRRSCQVLALSGAVLLAGAACKKQGATASGGHWAVPLEVFRDLPVVQVTDAEGGVHDFVLDTGASFTIIDSQLAEAFEVRPYVDASGQPFERAVESAVGTDVDLGALQVVPRLVVGDVELPGELGALVTDLEPIRRLKGRDIMGIVGFQSFAMPFTVDYPRSRLVLHLRRPRLKGKGLPLLDNDGLFHPVVPVTLGDLEIEALLDTGSGTCLQLPGPMADDVAAVGTPAVTGYSLTVAGVVEDRSVRLDAGLDLGGVVVEQPVASIAGESPHIGGPLLKHFAVTFDPIRERVWVTAPEGGPVQPRCAPIRSVGFYLLRTESDDAWEVVLLLPGAEDTGIQLGDRVLAIAGTPIDPLDNAAIFTLWVDRDEVEVTVERDGVTQQLVVPVRTLVP